jgi:hypothetical protein
LCWSPSHFSALLNHRVFSVNFLQINLADQ